MLTVKLAWRNVWRNPRRTTLTIISIVFACAVLIFFIGIQLSSYEISINTTVNIYPAHLQIQRPGYLDTPEVHETIDNASVLQKELDQLSAIKLSGLRANSFSLVSSAERSYGVQITGVQPERERVLSTIPTLIKHGRYLQTGSAPEAIIGKPLAKNLRLAVGDSFTLIGSGKDGSVAASELDVVGIFESGTRELDRGMVQIPLDAFREIFSMEDSVHVIALSGFDIHNVRELQRLLQSTLQPRHGELVVLRWDEVLPGLLQAIELDMAGGWFFYASLIVIVTFSILNTFLMSVLERTHEFGVVMALGTRPGSIMRLVVTESAILSTIGVLLGAVVGAAILLYFGKYGFVIPGSEKITAHWHLPNVLYPKLSPRILLQAPIIIFCAALVSAVLPTVKLFRTDVIDALRAP